MPLAQVVEKGSDSNTAYYHVDHLGTPQLLTNADGEIAWQAEYKAWGEAKAIISQAAQSVGIDNPLRFQGQYFDAESGLHYNRHRYDDPETGRFISSDPIGLLGGLNTHAYAPNPVGWVDPIGLCSSKLNRNLGGVTGDNLQAHHLIPEEIWGKHQVFLDKIGVGGERDSASNGVLLPDSAQKARQMKRRFYHCGSHAGYSAIVNNQVQNIRDDYEAGDISASEAAKRIEALQNRLRSGLTVPGGKSPIRVR